MAMLGPGSRNKLEEDTRVGAGAVGGAQADDVGLARRVLVGGVLAI
jgi:hypothetical protein